MLLQQVREIDDRRAIYRYSFREGMLTLCRGEVILMLASCGAGSNGSPSRRASTRPVCVASS